MYDTLILKTIIEVSRLLEYIKTRATHVVIIARVIRDCEVKSKEAPSRPGSARAHAKIRVSAFRFRGGGALESLA